jgi:3D (Asp-Asp-Asp) domain-containing protein
MMRGAIIAGSLGRKLVATCIAMIGFVLLYEVSVFDLRITNPALVDPTLPAAGARLEFTATAYCKGTTTASGVGVRSGIAASDPSILPVGSVVNISTHNAKYNGVYTIMDTGPRVQGRALDLYMWSCHEALAFGRRLVELRVLRLGWNPSASAPSFIDRLFRRREATRRPSVQEPSPTPGDTQHGDFVGQPAEFNKALGTSTEPSVPEPSSDAVTVTAPVSSPQLSPAP